MKSHPDFKRVWRAGYCMDKNTYRSKLEIIPIFIIAFCSILLIGALLVIPSCAYADIDTTQAVIHHTASPDWSVNRIRKIHVEERGWKDVGYHFIIRKDGAIEKGRDLHTQGAHAKGRNNRVGIALTGYDTFTDLQIGSLNKLIRLLGIQGLERHHEECPGKGIRLGGNNEKI